VGALRAGSARIAAGVAAIALAVTVGAALAHSSSGPAAPAAKAITGTRHADHLVGTNRRDHIDGRGGPDHILGRGGRDLLAGGRGADVINARDGHEDSIDCGAGRDVVKVDRAEDGVYDCERVKEPKPGQKVTR
jgi:Ca2+-binding RTX toxin-like protein